MSDFDQLKIRRLDGGLLLIFRELLVHRRASEVSQRLGLSQSAISHALSRLRDLFGDPLFIRRSHGFEPTKRAMELGPKIEALIDLIGGTVSASDGFDPAQSRRRFNIGAEESIASLIAGGLAESFRREAPNATFSTRWAILDRAAAAVRRGEIDVALGIFHAIPRDLIGEKMATDEYCILARRGHPRVKDKIDGPTYLSEGHIFVGIPDGALADEEPFDRETMDQTYGPLPSPQQVRTLGYVSTWENAMLTASGSDAICECPRRLATKFAKKLGLQVLTPPYKRFRFDILAVRRAAADPGVDWFVERIKAAFG
jgi:DNA-binding transcriptional LysR family regulator